MNVLTDPGTDLAPRRRGRPPAVRPVTPAATNESASLLNIIAAAASNPNVDVTKLAALLDMQTQVLAKEAETAFVQALARMTSGMPHVKKNGRVELGGGKGYDFATWPDMDRIIRPLMEREGFTLSFDMKQRDGGGAEVFGTLQHGGGHSRTVSIPLSLDTGAGRNNLQAMGSTLSYGKRYCAEMLFNIVRDGVDDDGQTGGAVFIDDVTVKLIDDLLEQTGANLEAFLNYMGAETVAEIHEKDKAKAVNGLLTKMKKIGKEPLS